MWWLFTVASASTCEPMRFRALSAELDALEDASERREWGLVDVGLERVDAAFPCVEFVLPPKTIGRYAWLRAELAASEFDRSTTARWVRLARLVAPDQTPSEWVRTWSEPEGGEVVGPDAVFRQIPTGEDGEPKRGRLDVWLDGRWSARPVAAASTPHLVQIVVKKRVIATEWQHGHRFSSRWLESEPVAASGWTPGRNDSVETWEAWIEANEGASWVPEARRRLNILRQQRAIAEGGPGLDAYRRSYGTDAPAVESEWMQRTFDRARVDDTPIRWRTFLDTCDNCRFVGDAQDALEALDWTWAGRADSAEVYATFLEDHPASVHRGEARVRLADRLLQRGDPAASIASRFADTPAGARAAWQALGDDVTRIAIVGGENDELMSSLRDRGLRVRIERSKSTTEPSLELEWVETSEGEFLHHARLWVPGGEVPVLRWSVRGTTKEEAMRALAVSMPEDPLL